MKTTKCEKKHTLTNRIILYTALVVLIVCAFFIGKQIYETLSTMYKTDKIKDIYYSSSDDAQATEISDREESKSKFSSLLEINDETIGWLKIPGTDIDTVVVQHKEDSDGEYFYITHDFYKNSAKAGAIFIDGRNELYGDNKSDNVIIYGHNMQDGTMFSQLQKYKNIDFYKENPVIEFDSLYQEAKYKIIGYFVTNIRKDQGEVFQYSKCLDFEKEEDFQAFVNEVHARSYITNNVDAEYGDEFITLSTCSYEFEEARFVVVARKVRENESDEVDIAEVTKNEDIKRPEVWTELYG